MGRVYDDPRYKRAQRELRGLPCRWCGKPSDTVDHVVPVSRIGGADPNVRGNLAPACRSCNSSAGARLKHVEEQERGRYTNPKFGRVRGVRRRETPPPRR